MERRPRTVRAISTRASSERRRREEQKRRHAGDKQTAKVEPDTAPLGRRTVCVKERPRSRRETHAPRHRDEIGASSCAERAFARRPDFFL